MYHSMMFQRNDEEVAGIMNQKSRMSAKRWILLFFFLFMMVCTIISRIYDSVTVPKVLTTTAKRKTVETVIEGTGTVKVKEKVYYPVFPGLRAGQAAVVPGSEVQEGDLLFCYDAESMSEKKEELQQELEQISLNIEKERLSQESYAGLTQAETAQRELELAERELEEGQREYEEMLADHYEELGRLRNAYEDQMSLTEEELWQQQEQDWESARQNLDTARNSRDQELRAAQRKIEDLEEELKNIPQEEEEAITRLERDIKRAKEDMADLKESWNDRIDSASFQMDFINNQEDRIQSGQTSAQEARREAYETAVKQQEENMKAAEKNLETLKKAAEQARWQIEAAQKQDTAAYLTEEQRKQSSRITVKSLELDQTAKERELGRLEELMETGGQVAAMETGVVVDMEVLAGKTTTGEELLSLSVGSSQFEGTFLKEEQEVTKGDRISIAIPGTQKTKETVISRMNLLGDTEGIFQADLEDLEIPLGTIASYTCKKQSDIFLKVIPLEGLRKDMKGYYCLVARSRTSILGEEFRAERVEVQLLYQGSQEAAVEGSIFESDVVIVGENQTIHEGDRVRPVSGF